MNVSVQFDVSKMKKKKKWRIWAWFWFGSEKVEGVEWGIFSEFSELDIRQKWCFVSSSNISTNQSHFVSFGSGPSKKIAYSDLQKVNFIVSLTHFAHQSFLWLFICVWDQVNQSWYREVKWTRIWNTNFDSNFAFGRNRDNSFRKCNNKRSCDVGTIASFQTVN